MTIANYAVAMLSVVHMLENSERNMRGPEKVAHVRVKTQTMDLLNVSCYLPEKAVCTNWTSKGTILAEMLGILHNTAYNSQAISGCKVHHKPSFDFADLPCQCLFWKLPFSASSK